MFLQRRNPMILAIGTCLVGCDDSSSSPSEVADVRVLHLAPVAGPVDVVVDGATPPAITSLAYGSATPYVALDAGTHDFSVRAAGTTTVALALDDLALADGASVSAVAWGTSTVKGVLVNDSLDGLAAGSFRVNVVHAAEGVGQVDLWNVPSSGSPSPLITDFDEGEQGSLDLPAAAYRVGIDVDDDATPDLLFSLPALAAGQVVDVFAVREGDDVRLAAMLPSSAVVMVNPDP